MKSCALNFTSFRMGVPLHIVMFICMQCKESYIEISNHVYIFIC
jgi:hypothetical protein